MMKITTKEEIRLSLSNLTRTKLLEYLSNYGYHLECIPDNFKDDQGVIIEALSNGGSLKFASERLKNDKEVVLKAMEHDYMDNAILFASDELRNNREFIIEALSIHGEYLQHIPENLKHDKEIVLTTILKQGTAIQYAPECIRNDSQFFIPAIIQDCRAFLYLSEELQNNKEIISLTLSNNGAFLSKVSDKFKDDKDIVITAINQNPTSFEYVSDRLQNDLNILLILKYKSLNNKYLCSMEWHQEAMKKLDILLEQKFLDDNAQVNSRTIKRSIKF